MKTSYLLGKRGNLDYFHGAWLDLWKLEISPKACHFMWRVCTNFLPVRAALHARHILDVGTCPWCPDHDKTMFHALMGCERIQPLWEKCGCEEMVKDSEEMGFLELMAKWSKIDAKMVQRGCFLAWNIWYEQDMLVFENKSLPLDVIAQRVFR